MSTAGPAPARDVRLGRTLFGVMIAVIAAALLYSGVAPEHWLRGVIVFAAALLFGGVCRILVPAERAGPLAVRGKWFDTGCYVAGAIALAGFGLLVK